MGWMSGSPQRRSTALQIELLSEHDEHVPADDAGAAMSGGDAAAAAEPPAIQPSVVTVVARRAGSWLRARPVWQLVSGAVEAWATRSL